MKDISNCFVIDERKNRKRRKKPAKTAYIRSKSRHRGAKFLTAVAVMAAVAAAAVGILTVDYNSCLTGWNEDKTELAFSVSGNRLDITVMGRRYEADTGFLTRAHQIAGRIERGVYIIKPPAARLLDMLCLSLRSELFPPR